MSVIEIFNMLMMNVFSSSILLFVIFIVRKKFLKNKILTISEIVLLYCFTLARLIIPLDHQLVMVVDMKWLNPISDFLFFTDELFKKPIFPAYKILGISYTVIVLSALSLLLVRYIKMRISVKSMTSVRDNRINGIASDAKKKVGINNTVDIKTVGEISSPLSIGGFRKTVILPKELHKVYSDEELYNIFLHEFTHIKNRDFLILLLATVTECLFFWNPLVYRMKADLEQSLEIRCDKTATRNMTKTEKKSYLQTILDAMKKDEQHATGRLKNAVALSFSSDASNMIERFELIKADKGSRINPVGVAFTALLAAFFVASYFIVFTASYEPNIEDIVGPNNEYVEMNPKTDYIREDSAGNYYLILSDGSVFDSDYEEAQFWEGIGGKVICE